MSRPSKMRKIWFRPQIQGLMPVGVAGVPREGIIMTLDEIEALRLADYQGKSQEDAAAEMGISRQTFGRVVARARRKMAGAIIHGRPVVFEGGTYEVYPKWFHCDDCAS